MISLVWRLLPYVLVPITLILLLATLSVVIGGAESQPTESPIADVTADGPDARWLTLTDGGLFLPEALVDEEVNEKTGASKDKAWYVPYVSLTEAGEYVAAMEEGADPYRPTQIVFVRFPVDEFLRRYPTPDDVDAEDLFRVEDVTGLRKSNSLFPGRLKDYIRSELHVPLDQVVVLEHGKEPMQYGEAVGMTIFSAVILVLSVWWIRSRWRKPVAAVASSHDPDVMPPIA